MHRRSSSPEISLLSVLYPSHPCGLLSFGQEPANLAASRRHNPIHPQILHNLPIVVISMRHAERRQRHPRVHPVRAFDRDKRIGRRNRRDCLVRKNEGGRQRSHQIVLRVHRPDRLHIHVDLHSADPAIKAVISLDKMLHLRRKRPHPIVLRPWNHRAGRCKTVLLRRHRLHGPGQFLLEQTQHPVNFFRRVHR